MARLQDGGGRHLSGADHWASGAGRCPSQLSCSQRAPDQQCFFQRDAWCGWAQSPPCPGSPISVSVASVGSSVCSAAALPLASWALWTPQIPGFPAAQSGALVLRLGSRCLELTSRTAASRLLSVTSLGSACGSGRSRRRSHVGMGPSTDPGSDSSSVLSLAVGPDGQVICPIWPQFPCVESGSNKPIFLQGSRAVSIK